MATGQPSSHGYKPVAHELPEVSLKDAGIPFSSTGPARGGTADLMARTEAAIWTTQGKKSQMDGRSRGSWSWLRTAGAPGYGRHELRAVQAAVIWSFLSIHFPDSHTRLFLCEAGGENVKAKLHGPLYDVFFPPVRGCCPRPGHCPSHCNRVRTPRRGPGMLSAISPPLKDTEGLAGSSRL